MKPTQANRDIMVEPRMIIEIDKELMAREEHAQKNFSLATGEVTMVDAGAKVDAASIVPSVSVSVAPSVGHSGFSSVTPSVALSLGSGDMQDAVKETKKKNKK